jgi:hypothetical protein
MSPVGEIFRTALVAAACLCCSLVPLPASAAGPADGPTIYRTLSSLGLLEDYLTPEVTELLGTLVQASGRWDGFGVNQPYRSGAVNAYLVDASRLPQPSPLLELDIALDRDTLGGNAKADEATGILFIDTGFLKSLVTVAMLVADTDLDTLGAVGTVRARGIDAFRELWDPSLNPGLREAEYLDQWVLMASGAAAFVFAHEMGHLAIGATDIQRRRVPQKFANDPDAFAHYACDELVQDWQKQQREIERAADDFAVDILSKVLFPEGVLDEPKLRFEIGAEWYMLYQLGDQMVEVLRATKSDFIRRMLAIQFGPEVFEALSREEPDRDRNAVTVFFPESHPASIRRAAQSLSRLAESPYSIGQSTGSSSLEQFVIMEQLIAAECRDIEMRRRTR